MPGDAESDDNENKKDIGAAFDFSKVASATTSLTEDLKARIRAEAKKGALEAKPAIIEEVKKVVEKKARETVTPIVVKGTVIGLVGGVVLNWIFNRRRR